MGLDFLRRMSPSFTRVLDRRAVELRTPNLFSRDVPIVSRTASADICGNAKISEGEKVLVRVMNDKVVVQRDSLVIAQCANPPAEFISHLRAGAGVASGEIKSLQPISQTIEIKFCD